MQNSAGQNRDPFGKNAEGALRLVLWSTTIGCALYLAASQVLQPDPLYASLVVLILVANGLSFWLLRTGRVAGAGWLTILVFAVPAIYPTVTVGLSSPGAVNYLMIPVIAGLVHSGRAALVVGLLAGGLTFGVGLAQTLGVLHPTPRDAAPVVQGLARGLQVGVISLFVWLTARNLRQSLEDLQESRSRAVQDEDRLAELLRESPDGILSLDPSGRVLTANPAACRLTGRGLTELIGKSLEDLASSAERDRALSGLATSKRSNVSLHERFEMGFEHADGTRKIAVVEARVAQRPDGTAQIYATLRDVTAQRSVDRERQSLQERLERAQRLESVGRLAGGMAHDFNNLLTALSAQVELVAPFVADPGARQDVSEMRKVCARGAKLTQQLLGFSRPQLQEVVAFDVSEMVQELTPMLRRLVPESVALTLRVQSAWVEGCQAHLESVIVNLVINAQDAMPKGGTLELRVESRGPQVLLSVSDTGTGMTEEVKARIFDPFFTTKGDEGTGLGLCMVHGIVTDLQGTIDVVSELGVGTTLTVALPSTTSRPATSLEDLPEEDAPTECARSALLVVEDQPHVRRTTRRLLERAGYMVITAGEGKQALQVVAEHGDEIALVVSDVVMPGMSGPELGLRLKECYPHLRFLFVSGYSGDELDGEIVRDLKAGFLAKPFTHTDLLDQVASALKGTVEPAQRRAMTQPLPAAATAGR